MNQARQDNPLAVCPECGEATETAALDAHLRDQHNLYQFRGRRRSFNDTLAALLQAVCQAPADPEAWRMLAGMARQQHGERSDRFLAASVSAALSRLAEERRGDGTFAAAEAILTDRAAAGLLPALAEGEEVIARHLALALVARWPGALPGGLFPAVKTLVADRRLPADLQLAAAAALLQSLARDSDPREQETIDALVGDLGKTRGSERLRQLEDIAGTSDTLRAMREGLEARVRMSCPRCGVELRRPEMVDHLWKEHRLVLDGLKVREPWLAIEDWLAAARRRPNPETLARCRHLAQLVDPEEGAARVRRMILRAGFDDPESLKGLLAEAAEKRASACPGCFALVPMPRPVPGRPLNQWQGRLSARGYTLELSHRGPLARLEITTPHGVLYRGAEPGHWLTPRGATLLLVGPFVALALAVAIGIIPWAGGPLAPVAALLGVALVVLAGVHWWWGSPAPRLDRAIDYCWTLLAPRLHAFGYSWRDGEFLASLALSSADHGRPSARKAALEQALRVTAEAATEHGDAVSQLAALRRLAVSDAVEAGADSIPLVVAEAARCLEGKLPLAYAEALLTDWETRWWTAGAIARLRVLLCDRAFEAGFEVSYLVEIGRSYPALGAVLEVEDARGLARLRLLWSQRATRPWDRMGESETVFQRAADPRGERLLLDFPDLLLIQEQPSLAVEHVGEEGVRPLQVLVCGRGVAVQDVLFEEEPQSIEVLSRFKTMKTGHELRIEGERFRFSSEPSAVASRLEKWFRFLFNDFLPQAESALDWRSPDVAARLLARGALPCPECNMPVLARAGEVGKSLGE